PNLNKTINLKLKNKNKNFKIIYTSNKKIKIKNIQSNIFLFTSIQFNHSIISNSLQPHKSQHTKPPYPSPTPKIHSNSHPSNQ
ncbi:hypothetical protein, partial [Klebsiella pneumoniae]|uniref:hypothetical protein n=1 Tax=Klebsiella pneumoniae TaxID=573 RepID=UPI003EBD7917